MWTRCSARILRPKEEEGEQTQLFFFFPSCLPRAKEKEKGKKGKVVKSPSLAGWSQTHHDVTEVLWPPRFGLLIDGTLSVCW